jgi:hypothetical protein
VEINYEEGIEGLLVIKVYRKHNKNEKSTVPILRLPDDDKKKTSTDGTRCDYCGNQLEACMCACPYCGKLDACECCLFDAATGG